MPNRYWQPQIANTQYIPTNDFIKQPVEDVYSALEAKQNQYNRGLATDYQVKDMFNQFPTREIDTPIKNQLVSSYNNDVQEALKRYNGNYGDAHEEIMNIASKYASHPFWNSAKQAYATQERMKDFEDKARAQGKDVIHFNRDQFENTPVLDPYTGSMNKIQAPDSQIKHNYSDAMQNATKLNANTFATAAHKAGGAANGYLSYETLSGISGKQVKDAMNDSYIRYMATKEGQQHRRALMEQEGYTSGEADREIKDNLLAAGMQQTHMSNTPHYMQDLEDQRAYELEKASLRSSGKGSSKKEAGDNSPYLIRNNTNKGIELSDNGPWFGDAKVSLPTLGESSREYNYNLAKHGSYTPTGRMYMLGPSYSARKVNTANEPLDKAVYHKTIAGYKIIGGEGIDPSFVGAPLTKGQHGTVRSDTDNKVRVDEQGRHYVLDADTKKPVYLQPQAYKLISSGNDVGLEEANMMESYRDLGHNLSGQRFVDLTPTDVQGHVIANSNITAQEAFDLLDGYNKSNPGGEVDSYNLIKRADQIERKSKTSKLTPDEQAFMMQFNEILEKGFQESKVKPSIINPKPEYTPKGSIGGGDIVKDEE